MLRQIMMSYLGNGGLDGSLAADTGGGGGGATVDLDGGLTPRVGATATGFCGANVALDTEVGTSTVSNLGDGVLPTDLWP